MIRPQVALNRANVMRRIVLVLFHVSRSALRAFFLAHPRNKPHRPLRMNPQLLKQVNHLHRHHHPRAIVNRASAQVPRIQMP